MWLNNMLFALAVLFVVVNCIDPEILAEPIKHILNVIAVQGTLCYLVCCVVPHFDGSPGGRDCDLAVRTMATAHQH